MNQNQRVLLHLISHGYITQTIANNYGIRRLASRINDLKKRASIDVQTKLDDAGVRYAYYTLSYPHHWNEERATYGDSLGIFTKKAA